MSHIPAPFNSDGMCQTYADARALADYASAHQAGRPFFVARRPQGDYLPWPYNAPLPKTYKEAKE